MKLAAAKRTELWDHWLGLNHAVLARRLNMGGPSRPFTSRQVIIAQFYFAYTFNSIRVTALGAIKHVLCPVEVFPTIRTWFYFAVEANKACFVCGGIIISNLFKHCALIEFGKVALEVKFAKLLDVSRIFGSPVTRIFSIAARPFLAEFRSRPGNHLRGSLECRASWFHKCSLTPALALRVGTCCGAMLASISSIFVPLIGMAIALWGLL
jgi:hypothetical protein